MFFERFLRGSFLHMCMQIILNVNSGEEAPELFFTDKEDWDTYVKNGKGCVYDSFDNQEKMAFYDMVMKKFRTKYVDDILNGKFGDSFESHVDKFKEKILFVKENKLSLSDALENMFGGHHSDSVCKILEYSKTSSVPANSILGVLNSVRKDEFSAFIDNTINDFGCIDGYDGKHKLSEIEYMAKLSRFVASFSIILFCAEFDVYVK